MIITKDFVLLNLPKTGSTYVRNVLFTIYKKRMNQSKIVSKLYKLKLLKPPYTELLLPNIKLKNGFNNKLDQHGIYIQIPKEHRHKEIVSVVRNPYAKFLSAYEFGWYKEHPALTPDLLEKNFPNFPDLSIDEYVDYTKLVVKHSLLKEPSDIKIGVQSIQFIKFFSKNPDLVIKNLTSQGNEIAVDVDLDLATVTFLQQENLNDDLSKFLKKHNFKSSEVELALTSKKINVTRTDKNRDSLLTAKAIQYIEEYEKIYIHALKKLGIVYSNPY